MLKQCIDCPPGLLKDTSEFHISRSGRTRDGFKAVCKEHSKVRRNAWAAKNRKREAEWNSAKYEADPEYFKNNAKKWRTENLDRAREIGRMSESARRARKLGQFIEDVDPAVVFKMHGGMCGVCEEFIIGKFHVDHRIPLVKGGMHGYINTQPAHPFCNLSKGAK